MAVIESPATPAYPPIVLPSRHGIAVVKFVLGCQVRDQDLRMYLVEDVPDCAHVGGDGKEQKQLAKVLYDLKAKSETKRVMCPICGREIGARKTTEVWKHNRKPPNRPFPTYLSDFKELQWTKYAPDGVLVPDVVLMGRIVSDRIFPITAPVPQVATAQIDAVKADLARHDLLSEPTFGFYFVGSNE